MGQQKLENTKTLTMRKSNIILIGMPTSGKSTCGKVIARMAKMDFIDTDTVISEREKRPLRDIVNTDGLEYFLNIQQDVILKLQLSNYVVATGGSVVYSDTAMEHLKKDGVVVFLKLDIKEIEKRTSPERRFARNENQKLADLFSERMPLYSKYADITVDCSGKNVDSIAEEIISLLQGGI